MSNRQRKTPDYSQYQRAGFVPEQDGHMTITYLPLIDGFTCHDIKNRPSLDASQWVEVIHRNGERSLGPVETFAWINHPCSDADRQDHKVRHVARLKDRPVFDIIDIEITHYRTIQTPPDDWVQGQPWPFENEQVAA